MAASITRPLVATSSPSLDFASGSTVAAGMNSASRTTGARSGAVMRMSGCSPGWPAMAWVFSERTVLRGIMACRRLPVALLALGSV